MSSLVEVVNLSYVLALSIITGNEKIGVLALQGAFIEHISMFRKLGVAASPVRLPQELRGLDGLVIPGGESTTIAKLMQTYNLTEAIQGLVSDGLSVLGTCAGMILLSKNASQVNLETMGAIDIEVRRNAFGRQIDSFEAALPMPVLGEEPFHAIFIRAPSITGIGPTVQVLADWKMAWVLRPGRERCLFVLFILSSLMT